MYVLLAYWEKREKGVCSLEAPLKAPRTCLVCVEEFTLPYLYLILPHPAGPSNWPAAALHLQRPGLPLRPALAAGPHPLTHPLLSRGPPKRLR